MSSITAFLPIFSFFRFRAPIIKAFLLFVYLLLGAQFINESLAQNALQKGHKFTAKIFDTDSGLRTNSVNNFMQDQHGAFWLGGNEGIVHFNGVAFRTFSSFSTQQSISTRFIKLIESTTLGIFAISEHGQLIKWAPDSLALVPITFTNPNIVVRNLALNSKQDLIIATSHGFFVLTPSSALPTPIFQSISTSNVFDFSMLSDDRILFYDSDSSQVVISDGQKTVKLYSYHDGSVNFISHTNAFGKNILGIGNRLYIENDSSIVELDESKNYPKNPITGLFTRKNGNLLISVSFVGVFERTSLDSPPSKIQTYTEGPFANPFHGYKDDVLFYDLQNVYMNNKAIFSFDGSIRNLLVDEENNIWLATASTGLIRLTENRVQTIQEADGLREKNITGIIPLRDGKKLIGTFGKGVEIVKDYQVCGLNYSKLSPLFVYTHTMLEQDNGSILMGAAGSPLLVIEISASEPKIVDSFDFGMNSNSLFRDSKDRIWVGSDMGVFTKYSKLPWNTIQKVPTPFISQVRMIKEDSKGNLFFCTNGEGVFEYDGFSWNRFSTKEGLSSNFVRDVYIESDSMSQNVQYLWIVSENNGLTWVRREGDSLSFKQITQADGLHHNYIHNITEDNYGRFWFGSNTGIFWVTKSEVNKFIAGKIDRISSYVLDENDGMPNREMNGGVQNSVLFDENETLWFPSQGGVVLVDTKTITENRQIPTTNIDILIAEHHTYIDLSEPIILEKDHRNISILFSNDSYQKPNRNHFSFRLLPIETTWSEPTTIRTVSYSRLPPKNYTFEVKSSNNDGYWNETPNSVQFTITPYFRETSFYYILWMFVGIVLISGFYYLRVRLVRKNEDRLQRLVDEKTKELQRERLTTQEQANKISQFEQSKSELLTSLSHEMRTPLSLLMYPIQELGSHRVIKNDQNLSRLTEMLDGNTKRLQQLIENLLDLSQLKTEEIVLESNHFELTTHIKEVIDTLHPELKQKQIHVNLDFYTAPIFVLADQKRIRTSLYSILYYVISQCPENAIIAFTIEEDEEHLSLMIEGPGVLTQEIKSHIFEPFKEGANISNIVGVGLSIVKLYAKAHGGNLEADKHNSEALSFVFQLPKNRILESPQSNFTSFEPAEELVSPDEREVIDDSFLVVKSMKMPTVLLVEDSNDMRMILKLSLQKNYNIIEASDGAEAQNFLQNNKIDAVLSDYMMPNKNGIELLKFVRNSPTLSSLPFILLSARAEEKVMLDAINQGADLYLIKPTSKDVLLAQIKRLLTSKYSDGKPLEIETSYDSNSATNTDPRGSESILDKAKTIIEQHYPNPEFGVENLSEIMEIERTNLFRKLKSEGDVSPSELIQNIRMHHAKQMLLYKDFTVAEVAFSCGFSSPSYFSQSFKATEGVTPRQFIKRNRE